jgi:hypothetical protein
MRAAVIGAKDISVRSADEQCLRVAGRGGQGFNVSTLRTDGTPILSVRANCGG